MFHTLRPDIVIPPSTHLIDDIFRYIMYIAKVILAVDYEHVIAILFCQHEIRLGFLLLCEGITHRNGRYRENSTTHHVLFNISLAISMGPHQLCGIEVITTIPIGEVIISCITRFRCQLLTKCALATTRQATDDIKYSIHKSLQ